MKAEEFQWVHQSEAGGLAVWQAYDPATKVDLSSSALRIGRELLFIDPIPLADAALASLIDGATPAGLLLTNENHERAAADFARQFGIPIRAHREALPAFPPSLAVEPFEDGARLFGALTAIALPGGPAGETALYWPGSKGEPGGVLILGDALINLESTGFAFLPERYCQDAKALKASARKLLAVHAEPGGGLRAIAFAHGTPLVTAAAERLRALVGTEA